VVYNKINKKHFFYDMPMTALELGNDVRLQSTPSHSATSLDPPSTSSSAAGSAQPKSEHRVSLGMLDSTKFRLSHDVRVLVPSSLSFLSPFVPNTCCTHAFFPVCTSHSVTQLSFLKVNSHRKDCRAFILIVILPFKRVLRCSPLILTPTEHTRLARVSLGL